MKKHKCRRSPEEIAQHDMAVKIRKMTDGQICDFIEEIQENAKCVDIINFGREFVLDFINGLHSGHGIGQATIAKIKACAREQEFLPPESEETS